MAATHFPPLTEQKWVSAVQTITAVSTAGTITVASTVGFHTQQTVQLFVTGQGTAQYIVRRIISDTDMSLGPVGAQFSVTVPADQLAPFIGGQIVANEQPRNPISQDAITRAVYAEEPTVALRVNHVDYWGNQYNDDNPLPVAFDGTISIGDVSVVDPTTGVGIKVNADGSINVEGDLETFAAPTTCIYGEITNVAIGSTATVLTYTVPAGQTFLLETVQTSSDSVSIVDIRFNGVKQSQVHLSWCSFNLNLNFGTLTAPAGTVITVNGTNYSVQTVASFNASLIGTFK